MINEILKDGEIPSLIQKENFIGWIYHIDYENACVMTNDIWKERVLGVPNNCFLLAASFDPEQYDVVDEASREVILLRVTGSCKLPQDDDLIRTKIDNYLEQTEPYENEDNKFDSITRNIIQFGGLNCRILGTFYMKENKFYLGSDIESYAMSTRLSVYKPRRKVLERIVNYIDPIKKSKAIADAKEMGLTEEIKPFKIGTVRYTSTDRLHRNSESEKVNFSIQATDFLARRTAVLGMTRTGKSNMIKQTVSVVKKIANESNAKIGQIIYDMNGEYANANQQDDGSSIADLYKDDVIRYRIIHTNGFLDLKTNFYTNILDGFEILQNILEEENSSFATDISVFLSINLERPFDINSGEFKRWEVRQALYKTILYKVGLVPPQGYMVKFEMNKNIREALKKQIDEDDSLEDYEKIPITRKLEYTTLKLNFNESETIFKQIRKLHKTDNTDIKKWIKDDIKSMLNVLAQLNDKDTFIKGYKQLIGIVPYHTMNRDDEVTDEIYKYLADGKIVILDLSVGPANLRENISKRIARKIFNKSMQTFIEANTPPNIVIYVEEAHNLIGKELKLTEVWPRIAKEGAKYKIALVYSTQEVSSIHPNILANTENWFVSHINNEKEVRELSKFYDFDDFCKSLLRAQDVGFTRVKTLSSPFVVPVQIDKFDPKKELNESNAI